MASYRTKTDDMLDAICYEYYGEQSGALEAVYQANPGLCEYPLRLPAGLVIELPVLDQAGVVATVDLFG